MRQLRHLKPRSGLIHLQAAVSTPEGENGANQLRSSCILILSNDI